MFLNQKKQELKRIYSSLNPAQLKRNIDRKLDILYKAYKAKQNQETQSVKVEINKKVKPRLVRKYIAEWEPVSV